MFGHQDKLLKAVTGLQLSVIDYRSFHPHGDFNVHVVNEVYLKDNATLVFNHSSKLEEDTAVCTKRMAELYKAAVAALKEETANVKVFRWLPGAGMSAKGISTFFPSFSLPGSVLLHYRHLSSHYCLPYLLPTS